MKRIVVLTKTYHLPDFYWWYEYHKKMGYVIHVIDNESTENVKGVVDEFGDDLDTYERLEGWPNQWQLYDDICRENRYNWNDGDYVAFIDDDEYIWYYIDYWKLFDKANVANIGKQYDHPSFEAFLNSWTGGSKDHPVLMPQILMSTSEVTYTRFKPVIEHCIYRREDTSTQGKVFICYDHTKQYQFNHCHGENGHVPFIDGVRKSIVNGAGLSETTYGGTDYTACLRLYHYHIKSRWDWEKKFTRGSAAVDHQWYSRAIENNKNFGGYITPDFTMLETWRLLGLC